MLYKGNSFADEADRMINTCLYCGLISDIKKSTSAQSNSRTYIITVSGIAKIMQNINLSTFSELTSSLPNYQLLPDDEKTGIKFSQRTSANIIKQVLKRFITGNNDFINYKFTDIGNNKYKPSDVLKWSDDTIIENRDESFQNSSYNKFSNYNGSILAMIQDIASRPFNELYWTHEEGHSTLHYRPTPFDQTVWNELPRIQVDTDSYITDNLDVTDKQQYSIFKLLSTSTLGTETYSGGWSGHLAPLTNEELIRLYGYKVMEVSTDYFNGNSQEKSTTSNDSNLGNQNLSSKTKSYASLVKKACSTYNCSSIYPYAMAVLQLETSSGSSANDPANTSHHGSSATKNATDSINYLVSTLSKYDSSARSAGINDKLVAVQCYNYGSGFIDYLKSVGSKSLSITDSINYSKKLAKNNKNSKLVTVPYNTSVSNLYGKDYLYKNGGNFYYAYEAKQYIGSNVSSSSNTSSNSNAKNTTITEAQAKQSYPPYDSIQDVFALAEGKKGTNTITIPAKYGSSGTYDSIISLLSKNTSRNNFVTKATGLSSAISKNNADQIYSQYHSSNYSGASNKMSRSRYLNIIAPQYYPTNSNISSGSTYLKSYKKIKDSPKKAAIELIQELNYSIGSKQAYEIIEKFLSNKGKISESEYNAILSKYPYNDTEDGVDPMNDGGTVNSVPYLFYFYTKKLFNWYADNSKYHSGDISIYGTSGIEIGKRLLLYDGEDNAYWEYYIESVSHSYSISSGWITTIGVTRGLPLSSPDDQRRFTYPYSYTGHGYPFRGGYFGENDLATAESLYANSDSSSSSSDDSGDDTSGGSDSFSPGSSTANKAYNKAASLLNKDTTWRASFQNVDPWGENNKTIYGTCSQLVYFAYKYQGAYIGSDDSHVTWTMASSNKVKTIGSRGSNKNSVYNKIHEGDLIFFDPGGEADGHIGIAGKNGIVAFNGDETSKGGVKKFSLKGNSYWWGCFSGHVCRLKE